MVSAKNRTQRPEDSTNTLWEEEKCLALWGVFEKPYERLFLWDDSNLNFIFFYCKSLFDCWKNQVIRGIMSHHKFFMNLT